MRRTGTRTAVALASAGALAGAVPWLARPAGVDVGVRTAVEIADHLVPGLVIVAGAVVLAAGAAPLPALLASAACLLAAVWMAASHLPLLADAGDGVVPWGDALVHAVPGLVVAALAAWVFAGQVRAP